MADHKKEFVNAIAATRKKKSKRVTVVERQKALVAAKHYDQQFSPGQRGNKHRFRDMIMKSPDPKASIGVIRKHLEKQ